MDNSIFDQGSYVVDHFDQKGVKVSIKFWEEYVLDDQLRELLKKVGHDGWEDSPEFESNVTWARSIPSRFESIFGYSILPYLPLLAFHLNFEDRIDSYRQFVGPANLAGKRIISNELGAVLGSSFCYRLSKLLFSANRGFAAGVNQYILHLQSFSGNYYQMTWHKPWSPRQPVWDHGLKELVDYISRIRHIQQKSAWTLRTVYESSDLVSAGWSYNYLTSDNILSDQAAVESGILAPTPSSWRALAIGPRANVNSGLPIILVGESPY
ncbi:hypothetical protein F5X98DRAFT_368489 [Xylaria grammica]|nr:hypothetical protein F5X98DRAFT_368489 [Xylaria grammica]